MFYVGCICNRDYFHSHKIQENEVPLFQQITFIFPEYIFLLLFAASSSSSLFLSFCLFSFSFLYFLPRSLFRLSAFHISSLTLLIYLPYFPLELSLHTIANNPVKESHLCSRALSINSPFFSSSHHWSLYFYILVSSYLLHPFMEILVTSCNVAHAVSF